MKKLSLLLLSVIITSFSCVSADAASNIINMQLGNGVVYKDGAAISDGTQKWTQFSATGIKTYNNLEYSDSTVLIPHLSNVSVTENMTTKSNWIATNTLFNDSLDLPLMRGALSTGANPGYFYFNGLTTGVYDMYIYSQGKKNATSNVNITAYTHTGSSDLTNSIIFSNNGDLKSLSQASSANHNTGNWYKQTIVVDSFVTGYGNNNLVLIVGPNTLINGIQLAYVSGDIGAVPEPDSVMLLGVGGVFFLGLMRIRAKEEVSFCD